jgi:hypothetical protein
MIGTLKVGALLQGLVAAVEVIVPELIATVIWLDRPIRPDEADTMVGLLLNVTVPLERLRIVLPTVTVI